MKFTFVDSRLFLLFFGQQRRPGFILQNIAVISAIRLLSFISQLKAHTNLTLTGGPNIILPSQILPIIRFLLSSIATPNRKSSLLVSSKVFWLACHFYKFFI